MKVLARSSVAGSIIALALLGACSDKKNFARETQAATAESKDDNVKPVPKKVDPAPPAPVIIVTPEVETSNVFKDCEASASSRFVADLYQLPIGTQKLPDFSALTPVKKICLKQIDIATRKFTEGFPDVEGLYEWFALSVNVNLNIATAGEYKFKVNSDDGSKLFIDGALVIDNDGQHPTKAAEGTVQLTAGSHKMNLQYFQGPADEIALELFWTPPGGTESYIPADLVTRQ